MVGPEGVPSKAKGPDVPVAAAGARRRYGTEGPWRAGQRSGRAGSRGAEPGSRTAALPRTRRCSAVPDATEPGPVAAAR